MKFKITDSVHVTSIREAVRDGKKVEVNGALQAGDVVEVDSALGAQLAGKPWAKAIAASTRSAKAAEAPKNKAARSPKNKAAAPSDVGTAANATTSNA